MRILSGMIFWIQIFRILLRCKLWNTNERSKWLFIRLFVSHVGRSTINVLRGWDLTEPSLCRISRRALLHSTGSKGDGYWLEGTTNWAEHWLLVYVHCSTTQKHNIQQRNKPRSRLWNAVLVNWLSKTIQQFSVRYCPGPNFVCFVRYKL